MGELIDGVVATFSSVGIDEDSVRLKELTEMQMEGQLDGFLSSVAGG